MRFQISRETFLSGLSPVQGVAETKKTLPILSHLLIETNP
ncbi:MAG: DNA polymerase III subunit beta, partial [candidate division NC10 bacterium]|nr:DNA polymerase III subunit beta [candidate division NC10 bacterium]